MSNQVKRYVWVDNPPRVFVGALSTTFSAALKTFTSVTASSASVGSSSDLLDGRTLELWSSDGVFAGSQRIRGNDGLQVLIGRSARGDKIGEVNPVGADEIWVYDEYKLWTKNPFIRDDGTILRDETLYTTAAAALKPVANCGAFQFAIGNGSDVTFTLQDTGSFATFQGATISSQSWDIADGTVVSGTTSDTSLTVSFPSGRRYVRYTVTDSNGVSHTTKQLVVNESESNLLEATSGTISSGVDTLEATVTAETVESATLRDGTAAAVIDVAADGTQRIAAFGWLASHSTRQVDAVHGVYETSLQIEGAGERLSRLGAFPQVISRAADVAGTWLSVDEVNIDRMITFVLYWHSTVFDVLDYTQSGLGSSYPLPELVTDGENLLRQFDRLFRAIVHRMTVSRSGELVARLDKRLAPTDDQRKSRASDGSFVATIPIPAVKDLTPLDTITQDDYAAADITTDNTPQTKWLKSEALIAGTDADNVGALFARAPSATPAQGANDARLDSQVVVRVNGTFELLFRTANAYEMENNNPTRPVTLRNVESIYDFDASAMQVFKVNFDPDTEAEHGFDRDDDRWLLTQVTERYKPQHGYVERDLIVERILIGQSAEIIDNPEEPAGVSDADYSLDSGLTQVGDQIETPLVFPNSENNLDGLSANLVAFLSSGEFAVTSNADDAGGAVNWTVYDHSATIGTSVYAWSLKAGTTAVSGWLTTNTGVWYVEGAQNASPTFTDQTPPFTNGFNGIDADFITAPGEVVIVSGTSGSLSALYISKDGGSTWTERTGYGQGSTHTVVADRINPGVMYASVDRGDFKSRIWRSTNYFATGTVILDNIELNNDPPMAIGINKPNILYYSSANAFYRYNVETSESREINSTNASSAGIAGIGINNRYVVSLDPTDANNVAYATLDGINFTRNGLSSGVPTWVSFEAGNIRHCAVVNGGAGIYGFGRRGAIRYTGDTSVGGSIANLQGDLSTLDHILGIAGY